MTKTKKPKPGYTVCPDCGAQYKIGAPHMMFCPKHTCNECGSSFSHLVQNDPDEKGKCICEDCLDRRINAE